MLLEHNLQGFERRGFELVSLSFPDRLPGPCTTLCARLRRMPPYTRVSDPFDAADINLQARFDAAASSTPLGEEEQVLEVPAVANGVWNAILFWFEVCNDLTLFPRLMDDCSWSKIPAATPILLLA